MESINPHSSEPSVEDATPNDVKWGYHFLGLVDHLKLRPFDVLTSFHPKNETQLAVVGGTKALHDVGSFLLSPLMEFGILQESVKTSNFANYRF
jgi:hypothetical protein